MGFLSRLKGQRSHSQLRDPQEVAAGSDSPEPDAEIAEAPRPAHTEAADYEPARDRRSNDVEDPEAARRLGEQLRDGGDISGAEAAFLRAERGGDLEAIHQLAYLLEDYRHDADGAEAAWRRADDAGSAVGSMMLGVTLRGRGDDAHAAAAFARAEERGHKDAAASIGSILEDQGDLVGAEAAYRRADASGSIYGAFNLGLLLMARGDRDGAKAAWSNADERGDGEGAANLGSLLRESGDAPGAEAAYRRADQRGSALGAWQLGEMLEARGELREAQAAYERAAERGSPPGAFALAAVHLKEDDVPRAEAALARADALGHPHASRMLAEIARRNPQQADPARPQNAPAEGAPAPPGLGFPPETVQSIQDMASRAAADPVRFLTYHETRRLYAHGAVPTLDGRSEAELRDAAASGDVAALVKLGLALERGGQIDDAFAVLTEAATRGDTYALFRLGFVEEVHRGNNEEALKYYRKSDEAGDANGAGNAGRLLMARGDRLAAEQAFGRCFERGGIRALADHAGLMSNRTDATPDEISEVVTKLCRVEDRWVEAQSQDRALGGHERQDAAEGETGAPMAVFAGMWGRCDHRAMESGVRAADAAGSASGAYHLGILLRSGGVLAEAAQASLRAGARGYAAGWTNAAVALSELGDSDGAERAARRGDALGEVDSTVLLALCLDAKGDLNGSIEANRRADAAGSAIGALHLGIDLIKRRDYDAAEQAFIRAHERGQPKAAEHLQILRNMR